MFYVSRVLTYREAIYLYNIHILLVMFYRIENKNVNRTVKTTECKKKQFNISVYILCNFRYWCLFLKSVKSYAELFRF